MSSIRIDALWNLHDLRNPPEGWTMYVNQIPMFESKALRDAFYDSGRPDITLNQDADLLAQVRGMVAEIQTLLPPIQEVEGFQPSADLVSIIHCPTGLWQGPALDKQKIRWVRHLSLGGRRFGSGTNEGEIDVPLLSAIARSAILRLDALAIETAYRRHHDDLVRMNDSLPIEGLPPLQKVRVFVAYRRTHFETAKHLHEIATNYASGSVFEAYLDHHSMRIGQWMPQLLTAIEESDVFMPIVSADYAAPGTVGRTEFDKAVEVSRERNLPDFFAPIFVARPQTDVAFFLYAYDGLEIAQPGDIDHGNPKLDNFLARVATTVLQRNASGIARPE